MRDKIMHRQWSIPVAALCAAAFLAVACGDDRTDQTDRTGRAPLTDRDVDRPPPLERTPLAQDPTTTGRPADASSQRQVPAQPGMERPATAVTANTFVREAASSGMYEVESSKLAIEKETDASTQEFARKMIEDHEAANAKLRNVAREQSIEVPEEMLPRQQKMLEALKGNEGEAFARVYRQQQLQAHQEAVQLFENASQQLGAGPLGKFASETLPTLRQHLDHVKTLAGGSGGPRDASGEPSGTQKGSGTGNERR